MALEDTVLVLLAAAVTAACALGEPTACVGSSEHALYSARADPTSLELSLPERAAIVSIVPEGESWPYLCTGTFVGKDRVLTAAHCEVSGPMEVVVGDDIVQAGAARLDVRRRHRHPSLDLMLLEIEHGDGAPPIQPIPVLETNEDLPEVGTLVELAGFGETETGSAGKLGFVAERVVAVDELTITVDGAGISGACSGDSGGPLLQLDSEFGVTVAGVLSEGSPDCTGIDVYVRPEREWIAALAVPRVADCETP